MSAPAALPAPPPAQRRPVYEVRPFGLIYDALPGHTPETIQDAIQRLASARKRIDVANVVEIVGRVPMPPPREAAPPPEIDLMAQSAHLARVASLVVVPRRADRLNERLARCLGRPALTAAEEKRHKAMTANWQAFGFLPSANAYQAGCAPC